MVGPCARRGWWARPSSSQALRSSPSPSSAGRRPFPSCSSSPSSRSWPSSSLQSFLYWPSDFLCPGRHPRRDPMKVLITDGLEAEAVAALRAAHVVDVADLDAKQLLEAISRYEALIVRSRTKVTKEVLGRAGALKVVGRSGVGADNIDVKEATARKVLVVNAPTASSVSVAELAIGHMLNLYRHLAEADRSMKEGKWEEN